MVQTKSILLIISMMFYPIHGKHQLTDYQRIQMLADNFEAITYHGGGAAELQEFLDKMSPYTISPEARRKNVSRVKDEIQEIFDVRYRLVNNLKTAVDETYRKKMDNVESVYVDCCWLTDNDISTVQNIFPFMVDPEKMCLFSMTNDENTPPAEFPLTQHLLETFQKNAKNLTFPTWQYYWMKTGHLITYPATPVTHCDTFKHTFVKHYADICHKRREIVIVIDSSSRMSEETWGRVTHLDFAKEVAKTIVHFSSPKDRVAVITLQTDLSDNPEDDEHCFAHELALKTHAHHEELSRIINSLQATGKASYMHGFATATHLLQQSKWTKNKIIVFISAIEPDDENFTAQFIATYQHYPVTIYTVDVGNSPKVRKVLQFISNVSSDKPGLYMHIDYKHTVLEQLQVYRRHAMKRIEAESLTPQISFAHEDSFNLGEVVSIRQNIFLDDKVVGAVGVDLQLVDLVNSSSELMDGVNTYMFLFNTDDESTLMHPLIRDTYRHDRDPKRERRFRKHSADSIFVNIRIVEIAANAHGLIDRMCRYSMDLISYLPQVDISTVRQPGERNISTTRMIALGDIRYQGVHEVPFMARYSWMPIKGTPLAVCLVVGDHEDNPLYYLPRPLGDLPFRYAKHLKSSKQCRSFGRTALKDDTSVSFSSPAFLNPDDYKRSRETQQRVQLYQDIVSGKTSDSLFRDGIIDQIAITKLLHDLWLKPRNKATVTYTVWRYVYLLTGVLRVYPAIELPDFFNPEGRVWFRNAIGMPGISVISTPYLDNWGGGYVISVSHSVYAGNPTHKHTEGDPVFAVASVDITIEYFQFLIQELFSECMNETYSCLAIDLAGYVIIRETMLEPPLKNHPRKVEDIHITDAEPVIAKHMLESGYMGKKSCYRFRDLNRLYTYNVFKNLQVDHLDESPNYKLWHVPQSNVFILIKLTDKNDKETLRSKYENCRNLVDFSKDGPCYIDNGTYVCAQTPLSCDPWLPCTPTPVSRMVQLNYVLEEHNKLKQLDNCFNYRCREKRHRQECHMMVGCRWCEQNTNGVALSYPFCGEYDKCYHGRIRFPSPYPARERTRIGLILFFTVLCASALAVPFGYVIFRYQLSQEERRMTVDDDIGVTGTSM